MLNPLYKAIGFLLAVAYSIVPAHNLGLAIILLTCVVMLALFPLTAKQARSMISMQKVQPEIKRLQQKYKNDKQKQNEEILKFYQENKINPLAGCLPLVMQFPIFISLFHVLRSIQGNVPKVGSFNRLYLDICGSGAKCQAHPTGLRFLGMDLSKSLWDVRTESILSVIPYVISILLIIGSGWYQARQTMARQQNNAAATPINSQMQFMTKVFPVLFGVFSLRFASGLVVYWVTSNLWRIGQQHLVLNKIYDDANNAPVPKASDPDDDPAPPASEPPKKPAGGTGKSGSGSGSGAGAAKKPAVRRPGSPKPARDPNRANGAGSGAATPASAGNRRKKRKR
ncbi:MAG: YidC/Oxa1 family rane protein insertase [Actinomycetota bacterium]|nr:YidC/Oxa1 family rane protein insertase [Actinomycetota bacterium]